MREKAMHGLFRTGMTPYDDAVFFRKMNAPKECVELELARRNTISISRRFWFDNGARYEGFGGSSQTFDVFSTQLDDRNSQCSGSSYQFLS